MIDEVNIVIEEPADEIIDIAVSEVNGDRGQDGYTPIKGVDYFDGVTPIKGVDYFDGLSVKVNNISAVAGNIPIATADIPESTDKLYVTQADKNKLTSISGVNTGDETQSSLLNKLGYATDISGGALSPADHILFSSKQPAGAYVVHQSGKDLSEENFTAAEKVKLAGLDSNHFRGKFTSIGALPSGVSGDYADVDLGVGSDVVRYIWDVDDAVWVTQSGTSSSETAASIKTKYESNADTYAFTSAYRDAIGNKVDKVTGSRLLTSAEATILANTGGINTGDNSPNSLYSGHVLDTNNPHNVTASQLGLVIGTNVLAQRTFGTAANNNTEDFLTSDSLSAKADINLAIALAIAL